MDSPGIEAGASRMLSGCDTATPTAPDNKFVTNKSKYFEMAFLSFPFLFLSSPLVFFPFLSLSFLSFPFLSFPFLPFRSFSFLFFPFAG